MRATRLLMLALVVLLQGCGASLLRSDCSKPRISNLTAPSSYLVVLPYRYRGSDTTHAAETERINQVIGLQALRNAADMDGTHITLIEGDPADPRCSIDSIFERVVDNRRGMFLARRAYHSAVFLWGEAYDAGDGLTVQTHLRTYWNGEQDRKLAIVINRPFLERPLHFTGDMPDFTISFPLQRLRVESLSPQHSPLEVRASASSDATPAKVPRKFIVGRWRNPWLELIDREGPSVWLRVPDSFGATRSLLPELSFARALTAYFNYRVSGDHSDRDQVHSALKDFRAFSEVSAKDPLLQTPLAMAGVLEGTLGLASTADRASDRDVQAALADAYRLVQSRADLLNLSAMARMPDCCGSGPEAAEGIRRALERAYRLDAGNEQIVTNLLQWYELMLKLPPPQRTLGTDEIARRSRALRRASEAAMLSAQHPPSR